MITIDQLFLEPFEPQWMQRKRYFVVQGIRHELQTVVNLKFMIEAKNNRERISRRVDTKGNYRNT